MILLGIAFLLALALGTFMAKAHNGVEIVMHVTEAVMGFIVLTAVIYLLLHSILGLIY